MSCQEKNIKLVRKFKNLFSSLDSPGKEMFTRAWVFRGEDRNLNSSVLDVLKKNIAKSIDNVYIDKDKIVIEFESASINFAELDVSTLETWIEAIENEDY